MELCRSDHLRPWTPARVSNRSGSSLAGIDYPMPRSLQAQLDTIQSEGEFKAWTRENS
ncbi:unnamed protein product [Cladocopium goreaui]|uniref:Uncharacterized protein n=1 Tax=Cladocopium goreaui TaxID=2562237 RepID=A0A9P1GRZ5_9DINO|nr:unnamed protein product [Cladocopium goreaui]